MYTCATEYHIEYRIHIGETHVHVALDQLRENEMLMV